MIGSACRQSFSAASNIFEHWICCWTRQVFSFCFLPLPVSIPLRLVSPPIDLCALIWSCAHTIREISLRWLSSLYCHNAPFIRRCYVHTHTNLPYCESCLHSCICISSVLKCWFSIRKSSFWTSCRSSLIHVASVLRSMWDIRLADCREQSVALSLHGTSESSQIIMMIIEKHDQQFWQMNSGNWIEESW